MDRIPRVVFLLILLAAILQADRAFALADILNIRHWAAPDHTRVVIDVSDDVSYSVSKGERKLFIDLQETGVEEDFPREFVLNKPGIGTVMVTPLPDGIVKVTLSLDENVETKVFKQKRFQDKPDRIVIDIVFPELEKQESQKREEEKVLKKNKIIIIDPGHGGDDPGAVGKHKTQEKKVVLEIGRKLRDILNKQEGYRAFLTRDGDYYVPFKKRLKIAREYGADLFVSIHADAFRQRGARGSSVYCLSLRGASSEAARLLARNENMADIIGGSPNGESSDESDPIILNMFQTNTINSSKTFGSCVIRHLDGVTKVKYGKVQEAPFIVLKLPEIPSILIETAYISNPGEEKLLRSSAFQTQIAKSIAAAVTEFMPVQLEHPKTALKILLTQKDDESKAVQESDKTDKVETLQTADYTIVRGDTLDIIARKHNIKINTLLKLNHMKLDDPLYFGRTLKVPAPVKEVSGKEKEAEIKVSTAGEKPLQPVSSPVTDKYIVKRGDTLEKVAKNRETTIAVLLKLNHMKLDDPLYFGRTLKVPVQEKEVSDKKKDEEVKVSTPSEKTPPPATRIYTVKKGDTLDKIAKSKNTTIAVLLKLNHMKLNDSLYFGRKLKVPAPDKEVPEKKKTSEIRASTSDDKTPQTAPSSSTAIYMVKKGDSLDKIAKENNTTISALLKLNKMRLNEPLYLGKKLKLPHTEVSAEDAPKSVGKKSATYVYKVKKGDTLDKIAKRCNTSVNELRKLNQIRRADLLYVDQKLRIPQS